MSGLISWLAGAPQAASTAGNYYENAANQITNAFSGPQANQFGWMTERALKPMFEDQNKQLVAQLNAQGLNGSGAGSADLQQLVGNQSAALSGAIAPLYQAGLQDYSGVISQMPGAQNNAYQNAIQQLYQALQTGASAAAGMPSLGAGASNPFPSSTYDPAGLPTGGGATLPSPGGLPWSTPPAYNPQGTQVYQIPATQSVSYG